MTEPSCCADRFCASDCEFCLAYNNGLLQVAAAAAALKQTYNWEGTGVDILLLFMQNAAAWVSNAETPRDGTNPLMFCSIAKEGTCCKLLDVKNLLLTSGFIAVVSSAIVAWKLSLDWML